MLSDRLRYAATFLDDQVPHVGGTLGETLTNIAATARAAAKAHDDAREVIAGYQRDVEKILIKYPDLDLSGMQLEQVQALPITIEDDHEDQVQ